MLCNKLYKRLLAEIIIVKKRAKKRDIERRHVKGQLLGMPVIAVIVVIVAGVIIGLGYYLFFGIGKVSEQSLLRNFESSLDRKLGETARKGPSSIQEVSLALPKDIQEVCFFEYNDKFDRFANIKLAGVAENLKNTNGVLFQDDKFYTINLANLQIDKNPLCVKTQKNKVSLKLESTGSKSLIKPLDEKDATIDCTTVYYSGDLNRRLDIVFLADSYSLDKFAEDVNRYVNNVFLATEPFKSGMEKVNFYRVDDDNELGCSAKDYLICDEFLVQQVAVNCPNDYIFVLHDRNKIIDTTQPLRSSSIGNVAYINTADEAFVAIHEFGHIFAKLADEYVDDSFYANFDAKDTPNCDDNRCRKWAAVDATGCFRGCTTAAFFRATDNSIMRDFYKSKEFGPVNEKVIKAGIEVYG